MIVYSEEQIKQAYDEGFKAGNDSLSIKPLLCDGWRKYPEEDPVSHIQPHGLFVVIIDWKDTKAKGFFVSSYMPEWIEYKWMYRGLPLTEDMGMVLAFRELVFPAFA